MDGIYQKVIKKRLSKRATFFVISIIGAIGVIGNFRLPRNIPAAGSITLIALIIPIKILFLP